MPRPTVSLELTAEERVDLETIAASLSMPHSLVRRAQLILWSESGVTLKEVGRRLKLSGPTAHHWRLRFRKLRLAGSHDQVKPGRPRTHDDEQIAQLLNTALTQKPRVATHWSVRTLGETAESGRAHDCCLPWRSGAEYLSKRSLAASSNSLVMVR